MRRTGYLNICLTIIGICLMVTLLSGCAAPRKPEPVSPMVDVQPRQTTVAEREFDGELVMFGKLRTVIQDHEEIVLNNGLYIPANEIYPILERELVQKDFRIFSGTVYPNTPIERLTRDTKAQLIITINAESKFVNSTGRFSKFRARADAKAIRGRDGTILASNRIEKIGPRQQNEERAGQLALRDIADELTKTLIDDLFSKSDQLLWAGLVIDDVTTMQDAVWLRSQLEGMEFISYVSLLKWDDSSEKATYEVIYGLKHDSDLLTQLSKIEGLEVEVSDYKPGSMEALADVINDYRPMDHYK